MQTVEQCHTNSTGFFSHVLQSPSAVTWHCDNLCWQLKGRTKVIYQQRDARVCCQCQNVSCCRGIISIDFLSSHTRTFISFLSSSTLRRGVEHTLLYSSNKNTSIHQLFKTCTGLNLCCSTLYLSKVTQHDLVGLMTYNVKATSTCLFFHS